MPELGCALWRGLNATPVGGHEALLNAPQVASLLPKSFWLATNGGSVESGVNMVERSTC